MRVEFLAKGHFIVCVNNADEYHFEKLDDAFTFIENEVEENVGNEVDVIDMETGEIIAYCYDDKDPEDWEDNVDECGYNPYMGCYDYDC